MSAAFKQLDGSKPASKPCHSLEIESFAARRMERPRSVIDTIVTHWPEQDCSADGNPVTCDARKDQDRRDKAFRKEANLPSAPDRVNVYGPIWEAMIARLLFHPCTAETVCDQLGSLNADTRYHRPSIYHAAVLGHIGSIRSALDAFCYLVTDTA